MERYHYIPLSPIRFDLEENNNKKGGKLKDRMNFNIVRILVDYGSDIHSKQ